MPAPLTYSWIALAGSAPVILLLTSWTLAIFHCRKRQWSTIDIFLVSILSQNFVQQFLVFTYALLSLIKLSPTSTGDAACAGLLWFFITIPIFKGATVASLAVDRCLHFTKFGYRLSVHKNHIRYHIGVLAVLACVVGFTALLTFNSPDLLRDYSWTISGTSGSSNSPPYSFDKCTFLPYKFDSKFVIFYIIIHVIIVITGLVAVWKASSCTGKASKGSGVMRTQYPPQFAGQQKARLKRKHTRCPPLDLTPTLSNTSTASSSISVDNTLNLFSTPGLRAKAVLSNLPSEPYQLSNEILLDYADHKKDANCRRLSTSGGLFMLTCVFTHLPLIVATLFSRYALTHAEDIPFTLNWPITNVLLWCHVTEGLITLLILLTVDAIVPSWIFNRGKKCSKKGQVMQTHYQPNLTNVTDVNMTLTASDVKPKNFITARQQQHHHQQLNNNIRNAAGGMLINGNGLLPTGQPQQVDFKTNKFPITNGSLFASLTAAAAQAQAQQQANNQHHLHHHFHQQKNGSKPNLLTSRGILQQLVDNNTDATLSDHPSNIYVSLTNDFDSFASFDKAFTGDDDDESRQSYHLRCASVTTVANDDFEFHTTTTGLPMSYSSPTPTPTSSSAVPYSQATYVMHKGPSTSSSSAASQQQNQQSANCSSSSNAGLQQFLSSSYNQPSTSAAAMAGMNIPSSSAASNSSRNQFTLESNFSAKSKVPPPKGVRNSVNVRERQLVGTAIVAPPPLPPQLQHHYNHHQLNQQQALPPPQQQLTSLSMNDLDLIEELPPLSAAELIRSGHGNRPTTSAEEYNKQPSRLYRKRPRYQNPGLGAGGGGGTRRRIQDQAGILFSMPNRRVLSLECLSPPKGTQTDSPFFDVSYLDTGDLCLVKQGGDGSRCIFVTDFL